MLTKTDLKSIDNLLDKKFDANLKPIANDIKNLQKDMTIVKKDVKKLKKDVNGVIFMADKGLLTVQKRVKAIETVLKIPSSNFI